MILAGDVGGTKTVLALYKEAEEGLECVREGVFPSREHASLEEILTPFLAENGSPALRAACFAVAGPVVEGRCKTTNLPWTLTEGDLASAVRAPRVKLLNDLEGTAYGMLHLPASDLAQLNKGKRPGRRGNIAVIAAGTGLGEAYLYWDGKSHRPIATEGGHSDFAPRTDVEVELLRYLREKLGGRVSYERVLSGPGVYEIYCFLRDTGRQNEPEWLARDLERGDQSALVSQHAAKGAEGAPICVATMDLFCELYGAEAGNMALRGLTYGGVFLGGGIAPKNLQLLEKGSFLRGFTDKGRFADMMAGLNVHVSTNPRAALLGAAYFAEELLTD